MTTYTTFHPIDTNIETNDRLAEIATSMIANGWQGLPLVADGEQLLNGAHRYTASKIAGIEPMVHQMEITLGWGDEDDYLLSDYADANDTTEIAKALRALYEAGYIDGYSVEIMDAENAKE